MCYRWFREDGFKNANARVSAQSVEEESEGISRQAEQLISKLFAETLRGMERAGDGGGGGGGDSGGSCGGGGCGSG